MKLKAFFEREFSPRAGSIKIPIGEVIDKYRDRYVALIKRKKFLHQVYTVNPGGRCIVHVKVPSETVDDLFYDVLLELTFGRSATDYMECDVKVFSNCPSFVYSYAYVFAHWSPDGRPASSKDQMMVDTMKGRVPKDSMLISGLSQKIGPAPTHEQPVVRNPMGLPLFDKSIFYACMYLMDRVPLTQVISTHNNVTMQQVRVAVADFDRLMNDRRRLANRMKERKHRDNQLTAKVYRTAEREVAKRSTGVQAPKKPMSARTVTGSAAKVKTTSAPRSLTSTMTKSKP